MGRRTQRLVQTAYASSRIDQVGRLLTGEILVVWMLKSTLFWAESQEAGRRDRGTVSSYAALFGAFSGTHGLGSVHSYRAVRRYG